MAQGNKDAIGLAVKQADLAELYEAVEMIEIEIERRRESALADEEAYFIQVWPKKKWHYVFAKSAFALPFILFALYSALRSLSGLLTPKVIEVIQWVADNSAYFYLFLLVLIFLSTIPVFILLKKEIGIRSDFAKIYPGAAGNMGYTK